MTLEMIASASSLTNSDIRLWQCDPSKWSGDDKKIEGSLKRQKTGIKTVDPIGTIKNSHPVTALKWITNENIVCGGADHQIKVLDANKLAIQESIFTNHKTVTSIDSTSAYVLTGMEDG